MVGRLSLEQLVAVRICCPQPQLAEKRVLL